MSMLSPYLLLVFEYLNLGYCLLQNKDVNLQEILSLTTGHPLTIAAVFGVITSGDTSLEEVIQLLQNPDLPDVTTVDCGQEVRAMDPQFRR